MTSLPANGVYWLMISLPANGVSWLMVYRLSPPYLEVPSRYLPAIYRQKVQVYRLSHLFQIYLPGVYWLTVYWLMVYRPIFNQSFPSET